MSTPWFLEYLKVEGDADARTIKRAYATLLKGIDQGNDIDGFTRLHAAYKAAIAWLEHGAPPPHSPVVRPSPSPVNHAAPRAAAPTASDYLPQNTPAELAAMACRQLHDDMLRGVHARDGLNTQCDRLGDMTMSAMTQFELLLIDRLAQGWAPGGLELFHAARERFHWLDVSHQYALKTRGQWLRQVWKEERELMSEPLPHPVLEALLSNDQAGIPLHALLHWPKIQGLIKRYPCYLGLSFNSERIDTWEAAYAGLSDEDRAEQARFKSMADQRKPAPPYKLSRKEIWLRAFWISFGIVLFILKWYFQ